MDITHWSSLRTKLDLLLPAIVVAAIAYYCGLVCKQTAAHVTKSTILDKVNLHNPCTSRLDQNVSWPDNVYVFGFGFALFGRFKPCFAGFVFLLF